MAMLYSFPSSLYKDEYSPSSLDEIEIFGAGAGGLVTPKAAATTNNVRFRLGVNSMVLHDIVVTVTFSRLQVGVGLPPNAAPVAVSTNGAIWTYTNNDPTTPAHEAKWTRSQINVNTETEFSVGFNVGPAPGFFQITYRVMASEFQSACTIVETLEV